MTPIRISSLFFVLAIMISIPLAVPIKAVALQVPELKGRVSDYADMISASTEDQIKALLADLERTDSTQIAVLTIDSLKGDSLEDFSIRVAEKWKIGQKGSDNGAILIIVKNDRLIRIEVGYGLEGKLTDLISGRIIRNIITPQFRMGRFDQGISDAVAAMADVVRGEYKAVRPVGRGRDRHEDGAPVALTAIALFFFINTLGRIKRSLGAAAGAVLAPIAGALFLNMGLLGILGLIPVGLIAGYILSVMGTPLSFGHHSMRHPGSRYRGGGFGGFSSGGFGGGFSGGGGGFGGGGASGGW